MKKSETYLILFSIAILLSSLWYSITAEARTLLKVGDCFVFSSVDTYLNQVVAVGTNSYDTIRICTDSCKRSDARRFLVLKSENLIKTDCYDYFK